MPPKDKTKEQKAQERAAQKAREAKAEDKTFGLKNKNKSKVVQTQIKQIQASSKAHAGGPPKPHAAEAKKAEEKQKNQAALLAGLFNMAVDKKGRAFDPNAKKKAKEKTMEEERAGQSVPDELQTTLVEGIKNAIRLTNPKGTALSMIGGSVYVREVLDDPKNAKSLRGVALLHFIRRRKADFWIDEPDAENNNPTIRCQEDVDAANAVDDRDMFVILEEKRQAFLDPTLLRVDNSYLKKWWIESARMELERCPDTGRQRTEKEIEEAKSKFAKRLTGEQLYKKDPSIFRSQVDHESKEELHQQKAEAAKKAEGAGEGAGEEKGDPDPKVEDCSDDELERDEDVPVGKAWGSVVDDLFENLLKEEEASSSTSKNAAPTAEPKKKTTRLEDAIADLPDDLDALDEK